MSGPVEPVEIFADAVRRVEVRGGTVRIEFASVVPADGDASGAELRSRLRLILPLEGFVQAHDTLRRTVDQLAAAGRIRVASKDADPATE